jgi:hypothetical protein
MDVMREYDAYKKSSSASAIDFLEYYNSIKKYSNFWKLQFPYHPYAYDEFIKWEEKFTNKLYDYYEKKIEKNLNVEFSLKFSENEDDNEWLDSITYRALTKYGLKHCIFTDDENHVKIITNSYKEFYKNKTNQLDKSSVVLFNSMDNNNLVDHSGKTLQIGSRMSINHLTELFSEKCRNIGGKSNKHFFPLDDDIITMDDIEDVTKKLTKSIFNLFTAQSNYPIYTINNKSAEINSSTSTSGGKFMYIYNIYNIYLF